MQILKKNDLQLDMAQIESAAQKFSIPTKFAELLFLRGFDTEQQINKLLNDDNSAFLDPFIMKGMKQSVDRINTAIKNKETVVVYGDYDADGVCATAILSLYLSSQGLNVFSHIPNRDGGGYGLNTETLERIIEEITPDLIITCDCGISCFLEVEFVLDLGVDIIITDHHEVPEKIPQCVVINPRQSDCNYPFKDLCGAGIAFKLIQALGGIEPATEYLDMAAIATVADLVPLLDENRLIVKKGLQQILKRTNIGIDKIIKSLNLSSVTSADIAFKIAPRLNAAGRMGDASRAFELLISSDEGKAELIIKDLEKDNENRKQICEKLYQEALSMLKAENLYCHKSIILYNPDWEKGITGIAAARLAGEFKRPVVIMAKSGNFYKGTARSVEGINIYDALVSAKHLLTEFGGHSQAAGFGVDEKNVEELKNHLIKYFDNFDNQYFLPRFYYDLDISESEIDKDLIKALDLLEPYGHSNPRPLFNLKSNKFSFQPSKFVPAHTIITAENGFNVIAFNFSVSNNILRGEGEKNLIIELKADNYNQNLPSGVLRHCHCKERHIDDDEAQASFLKTLNFKSSEDKPQAIPYSQDKLTEIIGENIFGALIIAGQKKTYQEFEKEYNHLVILKEYLKSSTKNNYNRLIIAPDFDENLMLELYDKIIFLDTPPHQNLLSYISRRTDAKIFIPQKSNLKELLHGLDFSRNAFIDCFNAIRSCDMAAANLRAYYQLIAKKQKMTLRQFVVCLTVFVEMELVSITSKQGFCVSIIKGAKSELSSSWIYNYLVEETK